MHQVPSGADLLILPDRLALLDAMRVMLQEKVRAQITDEDVSAVYEEFDTEVTASVKPFELGTETSKPDFDAVLAYQGGLAYVYLADRSRCRAPGEQCEWSLPPRLREDVLVAAEAFHRDQMMQDLEMILIRDGDEWPLEARRYFAMPHRSYHGSPARKDTEIPLVVAHPARDVTSIRGTVENSLGPSHAQPQIGRLLIELRYGDNARRH